MKEYKSRMVYFVGIMLLFAVLLAPCVQSRAAEFELKFGALNPEGLYMAKIAKGMDGKNRKGNQRKSPFYFVLGWDPHNTSGRA